MCVGGATSIYGSSKPLWVVDGVIMEDVTEVDAEKNAYLVKFDSLDTQRKISFRVKLEPAENI